MKWHLISDAGRLRSAWKWMISTGLALGLDTETFGSNLKWRDGKSRPNPYAHTIAGFSLSAGDQSIYVPVRHPDGNIPVLLAQAVLSELIEEACKGRVVWMHNAGYDVQMLINDGLLPPHQPWPAGFRCSQLATWLGWTTTGKDLGLKKLAGTLLGMKDLPSWDTVANGRPANAVPAVELAEYAARDAWLTKEVGAKAWARLEEYDLTQHYLELDLPLLEVVRGMAAFGMARDRVRLEELRVVWGQRRDAAKDAFYALTETEVTIPVKQDVPTGEFYKNGKRAGEPKTKKALVPTTLRKGANVGNDIEVSRWCYEYLRWWPVPEEYSPRSKGYAPIERNAHGVYSAAAEYVEKCTGLPGPAGEAARLRLEYQKYAKLISTYLDVMIELPDQYADGLLHPSLNVSGTRTQRFSGSGPNFQNIPRADGEAEVDTGREIRECLLAPVPGWKMHVKDYSQIELRLQAELAQDGPWLTGYNRESEWGIKYDLHSEAAKAAAEAAGMSVPRMVGKRMNLSIIYCVTPPSLRNYISRDTKGRVQVDLETTVKFVDGFFVLHPAIKNYWGKADAFALARGYIPTRDGFKRFGFKPVYRHGEEALSNADARRARNTPIQGWSGGIMKASLLELQRRWVAAGVYGTKVMLLNSVHDELVAAAAPDFGAQCDADMNEVMTSPRYGIKVATPVEGGSGNNWAEAKS